MRLRTATAAAALTLPLLACGGDDQGPLASSVVSTCLQYPQTTERVFRSDAEWQAVHRENNRTAPAVDFAQSIVAGHFDGGGSACTTFSVEDVSLRDGTIVVAATRHLSTLPCIAIVAYPQLVLQLPRGDQPVRFDIREVRGESAGSVRACT